MFRPIRDVLGVLKDGKCGPIEYSLTPVSAIKTLPKQNLYLDGYTIKLNDSNDNGAKSLLGHYTYNLNFDLIDHGYTYSFPLKVIVKTKQATTDEEIRAAINIPPGFSSFEPGKQEMLPGVSLMVGQAYIYELPKIKEWNEDDKVSIGIRIGHHTLAECNCITLMG